MKRNLRAIAVMVVTTTWMGACHRQSQSNDGATGGGDAAQEEFKTLEDRYSYAYGADLARQMKMEGIELNVELMAAGMRTVYNGGEEKMSAGEIAATLKLYQAFHAKKKEADWAVATETNKKEGEAFLRENAKKEGVVVTKSGLQYKVISKGSGAYKPTLDDEVKVQYRGKLIDGTEFDSTYSRNEPYTTTPRALIEGWSEALQLMSAGSKWELYVPANLAYGEAGSPPYVGPNAVLIFEVELLEIKKH